ncbi:MAG TPA: hypothetical protein VI653_06460 [Steroidobacteraceae bacterium]
MQTQDLICAVTVLFIVGMIWLRTRVLYTREVRGALQLQRAGKMYFAAVAAVLVSGWLVAPLIGRLAWPDTNVTPLLMRVIWFLATYYVFIVVHRILKAKGVAVYKAAA